MADSWTPAEEELRDALLDEIGYVLPGDGKRTAEATLRVLDVLERLGWAKKESRTVADLAEKIRAKVTHPPTVTSEGYGATEVNWWAAHASAALLAVVDAADADSEWVVHCIAKALGIEVDRG